jgi:hypothetical protein
VAIIEKDIVGVGIFIALFAGLFFIFIHVKTLLDIIPRNSFN